MRAVLFDIDGTLVDSNYIHVDTWSRAFAEVEFPVDAARIHRCIGMDSSRLLAELLGDEQERVGEEAKRMHKRHYMAAGARLRAFDGSQALLRELAGRGVTVVLSTSAPEDELAMLREVLDVDDAVAHFTSAGDVETAKPEPDVVAAALEKAGAAPSEAVMVGDTVWDVIAAARAGVGCVGVLSGGISRAELLEAGAIAVYDDVAQLLDELDASPLTAASA